MAVSRGKDHHDAVGNSIRYVKVQLVVETKSPPAAGNDLRILILDGCLETSYVRALNKRESHSRSNC